LLRADVETHAVRVGGRLSISFQRTRRVTEESPRVPPGSLGVLPVHSVTEYAKRLPQEWIRSKGVFIPINRDEALWIGLSGAAWRPNAIKVWHGNVNVVTGIPSTMKLHDSPQDYLVCPPQLALDGIYAGGGVVKQFVPEFRESSGFASPESAFRFVVYEPKAGKFAARPPARKHSDILQSSETHMPTFGSGSIAQVTLRDPHGLDTWDQRNFGRVEAHFISSDLYRQITGYELAPPFNESEGYAGNRLP